LCQNDNGEDAWYLAEVTINCRELPKSAIAKKPHPIRGYYYQADFTLVVRFGTVLEFRVMRDGKVFGTAVADYI